MDREKKKKSFKALFASSVANFGVQYNYTNIAIVFTYLNNANKWPIDDMWGGNVNSFLKSIVFIGSIGGMCTMGYIGDLLGRSRAFSITSLIMVFSSLGTAILTFGNTTQFIITLAILRFCLGFGIGGCYPLSAAKSAEGSGTNEVWERNKNTGISFFWQTFGDIAPYIVGMAIFFISDVEIQFRLAFALGVIPPAIVFLCTCGEEESDEYIMAKSTGLQTESRFTQGRKDPNFWNNFFATAVCWFIYDIAYYGNNQFTPTMTKDIFTGEGIFADSWHNAIGMTMGIPATLFAIWCLKLIGTKRLQVWGFLFIAFSCFLIAGFWDFLTNNPTTLKKNILFALYCIFQLSVNWGPNVSTFILPQEVYRTEIRSTFNGIASAGGKAGATVGIWLFSVLNEKFGVIWLMIIVGALNVLGAIISQCTISDELWKKQKSQMEARKAGEQGRYFMHRPDDIAG